MKQYIVIKNNKNAVSPDRLNDGGRAMEATR